MAELKPCPFCGAQPELVVKHMAGWVRRRGAKNTVYTGETKILHDRATGKDMVCYGITWVEARCACKTIKCPARSYHIWPYEEEAVDAWNRRADNG